MGMIFNNHGNTTYTFGNMSTDGKGNASYINKYGNSKSLLSGNGMAYHSGNEYRIRGKVFFKSGNMITGNNKTYHLNGTMLTNNCGETWYGVKSDDDIFRILESDN